MISGGISSGLQSASSPPLEEYGVERREVVRVFIVIPYSLTTPACGHPSNGVELDSQNGRGCNHH